MKVWRGWAVVMAFAPASLWAAPQQYVTCPGVNPDSLRALCGQLKHPPKATGIPARCNAREFNRLANEVSVWKNKIEKAVDEQRQIAEALVNLARTYSAYPAKRDYLTALSGAITTSLLRRYMEPLLADLNTAQTCIYDEKYVRGGCRYIPQATCYDRGNLELRVRQLDPFIDEITDDLRANRPMLLSGLPEGLYQGDVCGPGRPPCQQHMAAAIEALIDAEKIVKDNLWIPPSN